MYLYSFEKLEVWKESIKLVKTVYVLTNNFPENEKFGLVSQLRRATISISSNLAEGTSRSTNKDKAHFTTMAFSSLMEVLNQLILAKELNFIAEKDYDKVREDINKISNMLNAFKKITIKQLNE
ncbi:MAG TPA: four helix bundle protein [Lutibacter sp.]